jgi:hypothetical protein
MRSRIISGVCAAIVVAAFPSTIDAAASQVTVTMDAVSNSGQTGTAKFSRIGGDYITVAINIAGEPSGAKEPAMIHAGSCSDKKPVPKVTLNPVVKGKSITTQTGPTLSPGAYAIMVHKDTGAGMNTIVSCGEFELQ